MKTKRLPETQMCLHHYSHQKIRKQLHTCWPTAKCKPLSYMSYKSRDKTLFHYTQHTAQWTGCGARGMRAAWKGQRSIGLHWCWLLNGLEWGEMHSRVQNTQLKLNCPLFKENSIGLCRANGFIIVFISPFATQSRLQTFFMFSKL